MKKKKKKERKKKIFLKNPRNQNPCHPLFSSGIICGSHRGSFAVRDHLRSNLGIICGRGSFAALYSVMAFDFTQVSVKSFELKKKKPRAESVSSAKKFLSGYEC